MTRYVVSSTSTPFPVRIIPNGTHGNKAVMLNRACTIGGYLRARWTRSQAASALRMSRREMLGKRQVAAPLMGQRAAHGALRLAHRRFQPGESVGIQLAGLRLSGKP